MTLNKIQDGKESPMGVKIMTSQRSKSKATKGEKKIEHN
jgi:hypothetical protein